MPEKPSILKRWQISEYELTKLVDENPSLRGMLLGYIAEKKFHDLFLTHPEITETAKDDDHDRKKKGDRRILFKGKSLTIEVKSLQTKMIERQEDGTWRGKTQVDASDRREIIFPDGSKLHTTLLLRGEFDLLAVNCFAFENSWRFIFAKNSDLPCSTHRGYTEEQRAQLIASLISVSWPPVAPFYADPFPLLDELVEKWKDVVIEETVAPVVKDEIALKLTKI